VVDKVLIKNELIPQPLLLKKRRGVVKAILKVPLFAREGFRVSSRYCLVDGYYETKKNIYTR